jgi:hypothetical protein
MGESTSIRIDKEIRDRLQRYKNEHGMTYNGAILQFLEWAESDPGDGAQGERVPSSATSFAPDSSTDEPPLTASDSLSAQSMADNWGHHLYLGEVGSGKTTTAAYHAQHYLEHDPNTTVFVGAPMGGYERLSDSYEGTHITYDELTELDAQINHASNRLLYCDLQTVRPTALDSSVTETVVDWLYQQTQTVDGQAVFLIDGADLVFQSDATVHLLERMFRHARKHGIAVWLVTQPRGPNLSTFLDGASTVYLHQLQNEQLASQLGMSQRQQEYIRTAEKGLNGEGAEILRRAPSTGWKPFTVDIPDDVLDRFRSDY